MRWTPSLRTDRTLHSTVLAAGPPQERHGKIRRDGTCYNQARTATVRSRLREDTHRAWERMSLVHNCKAEEGGRAAPIMTTWCEGRIRAVEYAGLIVVVFQARARFQNSTCKVPLFVLHASHPTVFIVKFTALYSTINPVQ